MTVLGHYFLLLLAAIVLILWAASWIFAPSTRAKRWLLLTAGLFFPLSLGMVWWWQWPLATLSVLPNPWNELLFILVICITASLLASYTRRLTKLPFEQSVQLKWSVYVVSLIGLFLVGQFAPSLPWSNLTTFSVLFAIIAIVGTFIIHVRQLIIAQLITMLTTVIVAAIVGFAATQVNPTLNHGIGLSQWHIAWTWSQLVALTTVAAAWPALAMWWLNQASTRSLNTK